MSRSSLGWYRLGWPRGVSGEQVALVFRLIAETAGTPVVVEAVGSAGTVEHRIGLPAASGVAVRAQLQSAIPGLTAEKLPALGGDKAGRAVEIGLSTRRRPLATNDPAAVAGALLTALSRVGSGEMVALQWVLSRKVMPVAVGQQPIVLLGESWLAAIATAPFRAPQQIDPELRAALRSKQSEPGWRLVGRIAVRAASPSRERQLIGNVLGALRVAEAPSVGFRARSTRPEHFDRARAGWRRPMLLNASELATVSGWPVGETREQPVSRVASRLIAPARGLRRHGRVLGTAAFPGREVPLALTPADSLRHLHVLGPSGTGKSTVMLNLICQDINAGRGVVVIEPLGGLIDAVLARIPADRRKDVVVIDPSSDRPVGLNPLASGGRPAELVADQLLGLFHALHAQHWGPRTQDILGASLLTLARAGGMTLVALPLLLSDASFRRRILAGVHDPIGLEPFWAGFDAWSEPERVAATAPVLNKLRPLLMRPEVRALIGQQRPRFDLREVFTRRRIVLVNLAKGQLGPETSSLLGGLVVSQLWQAILGRTSIPAERRHPVFVYVDEFQDYLRLPLDFADALAQARGLGVGFTLAHQYLHQLPAAMRSALLANAQSRIAFRLPAEDARTIASDGILDPEDFQGLAAFECYAQLVADAAVQSWCSARTMPAPASSSDPEDVRRMAGEQFGVPRQDVERELVELVSGTRKGAGDDLSPRRRDGGGSS